MTDELDGETFLACRYCGLLPRGGCRHSPGYVEPEIRVPARLLGMASWRLVPAPEDVIRVRISPTTGLPLRRQELA